MNRIPSSELSRRLHRDFARYTFSVAAEITWQSRKIWGRVTDVSRGGLFIEMEPALDLGTQLVLNLALNAPLRMNGTVRRVIAKRGIGIVLAIPEESRKRFEGLLLALSAGADSATTSVKIPRPEGVRCTARAASAKA